MAIIAISITSGPSATFCFLNVRWGGCKSKEVLWGSYVEYNKTTSNALVYYPLDVNNPVYGADVPNYNTPGDAKAGNTYQTAD